MYNFPAYINPIRKEDEFYWDSFKSELDKIFNGSNIELANLLEEVISTIESSEMGRSYRTILLEEIKVRLIHEKK